MHELSDAVTRRQALLFVGAGVSANLGVPSLGTLIDRMAEELGDEAARFRHQVDPLTLAEYYLHQRGTLGPLRVWMTSTAEGHPVDVAQSRIHRAIVELDFPVIYTTNYDPWLERAFEAHDRPYNRVVRVPDITRGDPDVTQIVKLHGDLSEEDSVVFTESDYFDRLSFESPLDIKLRADVLCHSVLFIGYSLSDVNIRYLLYRLQKQWDMDGAGSRRPPSFMFLAHANPIHETVLRSRGIEPLVCAGSDPAEGLLRLLEELKDSRQ